MQELSLSRNILLKNSKSQKDIIRKMMQTINSNSKGQRACLIDITSTNMDVGPGKYEETRTSFPIIERRESNPMPAYSHYMFKSESPRISPLLLSVAPLPGHYRYRSITDEILLQKKIGKKGIFFSNAVKLPKPKIEVQLTNRIFLGLGNMNLSLSIFHYLRSIHSVKDMTQCLALK